MATNTTLFFMDFGLTNTHDGQVQGRILSCNGDGSNLQTLVEDVGGMPDGIDISENHLFYTLMGNPKQNDGTICRVDLDGTNHRVIVPKGDTFTPKQLRASSEQGKIYWCDREGMKVMRCNFDGSQVETLVEVGRTEEDRADARNWCVGVAIDARRNKFFWTQKGPSKGNQGRLFSANLDFREGEDAKTRSDIRLLLDSLPEPIDLALDEVDNALYVSDRGNPPLGNTITKITLTEDGVSDRTVLVRKLHEAIGLTLDRKHRRMFFTDMAGAVYRSAMDGSEKVVLLADVGDLTGITCVNHE